MTLTKKLCSKFCEELLEQFIIQDENILSYKVSEDSKDVIIKVCTEEDEYNFTTNLIQRSERHVDDLEYLNQYLNLVTRNEDVCIAVRAVTITGYSQTELVSSDLTSLKAVLSSLVRKHIHSIRGRRFKDHMGPSNGHTYRKDCKTILCEVMSVLNMENIDQNLLNDGIDNLVNQTSLEPIGNLTYVPSYNLENRQIFFKGSRETGKLKIINRGNPMTLPLVHDVLLTIFHLSDNKLRQCHFYELIEYYYDTLKEKLRNVNMDLSIILPPDDYEKQIKYFLPHIKLDIAYYFCQIFRYKENNNKCSDSSEKRDYVTLAQSAITDLYECCLYPDLTREDCYKIIENKIGSSNYVFSSWSMTQLEDRPGFLGDYFKLKITIQFNKKEETLHFFAKYLPTTNDMVKHMAMTSFQKEKFFYHTFISELNSLGLGYLLDFSPRCYFSRSNDVLVLDDLALKNYKSLDKAEPFSYDTLRLVLKQLAKLHACSILYEENLTKERGEPVRIDDKYGEYLQEVNLQVEEANENRFFTATGIHATLNYILDAFPDIPKNMTMESFKSKVNEAYDSLFKKVKKSDRFRNVICQGDLWTSNMLFKMKEDGTPYDCRIVDYQLVRYCPPTHDVLFLIYVNSDKETRNNHMDALIKEYYLELSKIITNQNFDMNNILPYQQFLESCRYMKPAAISIASLYLPVTTCPAEKIQEILADDERATVAFSVDRKEIVEEIYNEGRYRQRLREMVEDLYVVCESGSV